LQPSFNFSGARAALKESENGALERVTYRSRRAPITSGDPRGESIILGGRLFTPQRIIKATTSSARAVNGRNGNGKALASRILIKIIVPSFSQRYEQKYF